MAKKSAAWKRRRSTPQPFARDREHTPAPVIVKYQCPVCRGQHPRADCPTLQRVR